MTAPASGYLQRRRFKLLCLVALFACLNACGQIGPLFLPESESPESKAGSTPAVMSPSSEEEHDTKDKPNGL